MIFSPLSHTTGGINYSRRFCTNRSTKSQAVWLVNVACLTPSPHGRPSRRYSGGKDGVGHRTLQSHVPGTKCGRQGDWESSVTEQAGGRVEIRTQSTGQPQRCLETQDVRGTLQDPRLPHPCQARKSPTIGAGTLWYQRGALSATLCLWA